MSDVKQVKVDNWGIFFLQRLKHFFNRTDYCDLTLLFQDNAQLKVHRLVLNACTEYFELLERTCEMYEDCLVMPDDLQADVVVPIVNFMYTGHLEFRMDLLERLYLTSQILNMPVLTKLLESHRTSTTNPTKAISHNYSKKFPKTVETSKIVKPTVSNKRSYSKAFDNNNVAYRDKKTYQPHKTPKAVNSPGMYQPLSPVPSRESEPSVSCSITQTAINKRQGLGEPRPTRYELPEELDNDNVFDNSFCNISYECKPLMVHPENMKSYSAKRSGIFNEASSSKKLHPGTSTVDIVECKRVSRQDNLFDDSFPEQSISDELDMYQTSYNNTTTKDSNQLFDQILDDGPKVTIETKDSKAASNLDHAKIISEVLKKYPHLVKSNKNIKLKILNTPTKAKKQHKVSPSYIDEPEKIKPKVKSETPDYTYETDVIDSQQAAKLIAMGAENTKGPWICLICGTPGKALHFTSYYKFRRHLVEVHNEKPVANICEYCGLRSLKRNYLLHHLYSQHGVEPPSNSKYNFPKCNRCNYIALTEALLVKHKMTHTEAKNFRCNVCSAPFTSSRNLLLHIQSTGHKYSAERKMNLQCIYCLRSFLREGNLYAHLKTYHKKEAKNDGIIDDSDEEIEGKNDNRETKYHHIKFEPSTSFDNEYEEVDVQYQIQQKGDGDIHVTPRKQHNVVSHQQHTVISNSKQKILNPGFSTPKPAPKSSQKMVRKPQPEPSNFFEDINIASPPTTNNHDEDEIVLIDNTEYIMRNNQLIPKKVKSGENEYIISDMMESASLQAVQPTTSMDYTNIHNTKILEQTSQPMIIKKNANINQPIQIVVSNEEEYKALMASNHPIIFDNGEVNKTLAVLAAPHNAVMESGTIDLNNAQSNNMMIIQEDFPMNVTEAVSTENSNIVVVYSHPVDDQNKQFQILTTGGIGSQFVQSSAIITQNFETVTTSAPVMSQHMLESQAVTTWQTNVPSSDNQQIAFNRQAQLQNIVGDVEIKPVENEPCNSLTDLPEVHLEPQPQTMLEPEQPAILEPTQETILEAEPQTILEAHPQAILETQPQIVLEPESQATLEPDQQTILEAQENKPNDNLCEVNVANIEEQETVEQEVVEESQQMSETPMDTDIIRETIVEEEKPTIAESEQISNVTENISEVLTTDINQESIVQEHIEDENIVEQMQTESIEEQATSENIAEQETDTMAITTQDEQIVHTSTLSENPEIQENDDHNNALQDEPPIPESQTYDEIVDVNQHISNAKADTQTYPKETVEKIQSLASEWSEDEYDVPEEAPVSVASIPKIIDIVPPSDPDRLEESIENIRHEVQNHLSSTSTLIANTASAPMPDIDTEESESSTIPEDALPSPQEANLVPDVQATTTPAQNDPQITQKISSLLNDWDDNDSQEENNSDIPEVENKETEVTIEKLPNTDNIKSLVSDWDEEEEDTREQSSTVS